MADVGNWAAATLADYDDVIDRYANALELTDETVEASQQTDVTAYIAKAKTHIGRMLDVMLLQKFAQNDYDATTELKDKISNVEVLKEACVAWTLYLLFMDNSFSEGDYNSMMQDEFKKEFDREYKTGVALLRFDQDDDGEISQDELAQGIGGTRWDRV